MIRAAFALFSFIAVFLCFEILTAPPARCSNCIPTFCGTTADCLTGCVCAIPIGEATGFCMGTR